ncbi:MAG: hypothetical protein IJC16_00100 [Rikenellaceae bacterium]|nr:hypothetical protein [Rikenellaceae bacterium]
MIDIQNITLEHKRRGATQRWIYRELIRERFYIAESTYNRYLALPAKAMLRKLLEAEQKHPRLFD